MENFKASNRYALKAPISEIADSELYNIKMALNWRFIAHLKKNHSKAAESAKNLANEIRQEEMRRKNGKN